MKTTTTTTYALMFAFLLLLIGPRHASSEDAGQFNHDFYTFYLFHKSIDAYWNQFITGKINKEKYRDAALYFFFMHWFNTTHGQLQETPSSEKFIYYVGSHLADRIYPSSGTGIVVPAGRRNSFDLAESL